MFRASFGTRPVTPWSIARLPVLGVSALVASCNAAPPPAQTLPHSPLSLSAPYTLNFYLDDGTKRTLVRVVPREIANAAQAHAIATSASPQTALKGYIDLGVALENSPPTSGQAPEDILIAGPDSLIQGAAAECGMVADPQGTLSSTAPYDTDPNFAAVVQQETRHQSITAMQAADMWASSSANPGTGSLISNTTLNYSIFPSPGPTSCDQMLEMEETLICVADQLAQLADTVSPITWTAVQRLPGNIAHGAPSLAWIVPPPADDQRFVVRDLAMEVLADIPMFDADSFTPDTGHGVTCSAAYATMERSSPTTPEAPYPPYDSTQWASVQQERWAFEAGNLRAAGQLLHDLARESVYSDLAGAAATAAAVGDPASGQTLGMGLNGKQPYNSLAHLARVLMGRWDMEANNPDPQCRQPVRTGTALASVSGPPVVASSAAKGVAETALLPTLADVGLRARANDLGVLTANQSLAATLFEQAGLVVADSAQIDLGAALLGQLVAMKATSLNESASDFANSTDGQALSQLVGTLSPSDLARGRQYEATTFSLVTLQPTTDASAFPSAAAGAGLTLSTLANPSLPSSAGVAIQGGLNRAQVSVDPMARSGLMMAASQCPEPLNGPGSTSQAIMRMDESVAGAPDPSTTHDYGNGVISHAPLTPVFSRQDIFAVGNAIRARLVKLDAQASASPKNDDGSPAAQARRAAIAELGAWAGSGRMILSNDQSPNGEGTTATPSKAYLDIIDIAPNDFGLQNVSDLQNQIRLVVGTAKDAECAAHLANTPCSAPSVLVPTSATFDTFSPSPQSPVAAAVLRTQFGVSKQYIRLTFPVPATGVGDGQGPFQGWDEPFFVISTQDPAKATGIGEVLGTLSLPVHTVATNQTVYPEASTTLSPMRRELLNDAFGVGHWVGAAPPKVGETSISSTPSFCIEGIPRDIFVPLDNDLTDNTDTYENSWAHYLSLAQTAAANADAIGEELVNIGYTNDVNREGAGLQLMNIDGASTNLGTGAPGDTSGITINADGSINPGSQNPALSALLDAPMFDIVFFGTDPLADMTVSASALAAQLHCPTANQSNDICQKLNSNPPPPVAYVDAGSAATLTKKPSGTIVYTALEIAPKINPSKTTDPCKPLTGALMTMKGLSPNASGGSPSYSSSTALDPGAVNIALRAWGASPSDIHTALSQVKMEVRANGDWTVEAGAPIMDSTKGSHSWPGCLAGTGAQACDWTNPLVASLNDLLRWCPAGTDIRAPLGQCDGGPTQEINSLRWRVEGTLWLAAAMSGDIPAHMFTTPLPAANFAGTDGSTPVPYNTVFSTGAFNILATGVTFLSSFGVSAGNNENDSLQQAQPAVVQANSPWYTWGAHKATLPSWMQNIYVHPTAPFQASRLVHLTADNADGPSDFSNVQGFFDQIGSSGVSSQVGPNEWSLVTNKLGASQCAAPQGTSLFDSAHASEYGAGWLEGLVASLKTAQSMSSDMRSALTMGLPLPPDPSGPSAPPLVLGGLMWTAFGWQSMGWPGFNLSYIPLADSANLPAPSGFPFSPAQWSQQPPLWGVFGWEGGEIYQTAMTPASNPTPPERPSMSIAKITPSMRVPMAVNCAAPIDGCDAAWQFTQAIGLSCLLTADAGQSAGTATDPPQLKTLTDLTELTVWLRQSLATSNAELQSAYVEHVPAQVVASAMGKPGALAGGSGVAGKDVASAANALISVYSDWGRVQKYSQDISDAMDSARDAIALVNDQAAIDDVKDAIERLSVYKSIAEDINSIASSIAVSVQGGTLGPVGLAVTLGAASVRVAAGASALACDYATLPLIDQLDKDDQKKQADAILQALDGLHATVVSDSELMSEALLGMRQDINSLTAGVEDYGTDAAQASYDAGKASGADVWNCNGPNGTSVECESHVNTVLNRRYAGYHIRYQNALTEAKAMGYIARRAVEQRIGIRLSDITTPIGTLDAPSTWADKICSLQGIDYSALRQEFPDAGSSAQQQQIDGQLAAQYADAFVGDWVQKLTDFVTYYNVTNPEQDGNDTAILSLRQLGVGGPSRCLAPSPNLLVSSSRLFTMRDASGSTAPPSSGWTLDACATGDATCLQVEEAAASSGPPNLVGGDVSWLSDQPRPAPFDGVDVVNSRALPGSPDGLVSQQVSLATAGTYLLSWWDQARDMQGSPTSNPRGPYHVEVYDHAWAPIAGVSPMPTSAGFGNSWSARNVLSFPVPAAGTYHIAFGAAGPSAAAPGSVAIADAQLELAGASGQPTPYVDSNAAGQVTSYQCALSPDALRAAFRYGCDPDGTCYYDLQAPITIDTHAMTANGTSLVGQLAAGNFNFRHVDVALNLVGSQIVDCGQSGSTGCFGSTYATFRLMHDGDAVGVLGYDRQYRTFDFGSAVMDHAKALTEDRYLSLPLASTDQQLVNQFLQEQFRGRPIDGAYTLRIYDNPALDWQNLQDVQLLLNYHYWSRVTPSSQSN